MTGGSEPAPHLSGRTGGPLQRFVTTLAHWLGYVIVPGWRVASMPLARRLQSLFATHGIERVIDVGANDGQYRQFLRRQVGFTGRIDSFEPIPELAAKLKAASSSDPAWTVHDCALGSTSGEMTLNITAMSVFSSFLRPMGEDPSEGGNTIAKTAQVPVRTLDEVFPDPSALRHTYLKLDTQGFDLEVAKGGPGVLAAVPALQSEVSFRAIYDGMPNYQDSIRTFESFGFRVADFFLISSDSNGAAYEFDCIMVRAADAEAAGSAA